MKWSYYRYLAHAEITTEDERTITVKNPVPIADILDILTEFYVSRLAADGKLVLGTGPYRVAEFDIEGGRVVLERVDSSRRTEHIIVTAEPRAEERLDLLH